MEMLHEGEDVFESMLRSIDPHLLGDFCWNRLELAAKSGIVPYPAFLVEKALISPKLSDDSEDTAPLIEMIYATDGNLFQYLMEHILLQDPSTLDYLKHQAAREVIKMQIEGRDKEKGVTEEDLQKLIDLDNIQLEEGQPAKQPSKDKVTENELQKLVDLDNVQLNE